MSAAEDLCIVVGDDNLTDGSQILLRLVCSAALFLPLVIGGNSTFRTRKVPSPKLLARLGIQARFPRTCTKLARPAQTWAWGCRTRHAQAPETRASSASSPEGTMPLPRDLKIKPTCGYRKSCAASSCQKQPHNVHILQRLGAPIVQDLVQRRKPST